MTILSHINNVALLRLIVGEGGQKLLRRKFVLSYFSFSFHFIKIVFIGEAQFKKMLYRLIDTKDGEEGDRIRKIEMQIFFAGIKEEVERIHGNWIGSHDQNAAADCKIASLLRSHLRSAKTQVKQGN